jgi:DNA-directed RNA polymerase alpha subunit
MSGAHVVLEEADDTGASGIVVTRVSVNGVDVGRLARAPKTSVGVGDDVTTIMLTLIPSRLEIKGELADGDRREPRAGFAAKID